MQTLIWIGIGYFILGGLFTLSLSAVTVRKSFHRRCTPMDADKATICVNPRSSAVPLSELNPRLLF